MNFLQILSLGLIFLSEVHGLCKFTDDKGPQKRARCIYPFKFNQVTISSTFYARVFFYKIFDAKISNPKASFVVFGWWQILYKKFEQKMLMKLTTGDNFINITFAIFVRKCFWCFALINLALYFFGAQILAQKLLLKCWWNWLKVTYLSCTTAKDPDGLFW